LGTWNGAGQLTAYSDPAANMTAAIYDGTGLRASTTITPSGGSAVTQGYVWNGDSLLMDTVNAYIYAKAGATPAEQVNLSTGATTYLAADSLGSVRGAVSSSGSLTGSTNYDAWGNPETTGGLTLTTPFGYAGGYTDPDGLIYLINRYYDPATGQFMSIDPDVGQTLHPYAYTTGNPITQTDPSGLLPVNMNEVARWADSHVWAAPYIFPSDDCTNFVSEALLAGGYNVVPGPFMTSDDHYWFYYGNGSNGQLPDRSHSWSVAGDLMYHMVLTGSTYVKYWNQIQPGDIAFAVWNAASWNGYISGIDHAGVIGAVVNGMPLIEQHSVSAHHMKLTYWFQHGGPDVEVWVLKPKQD
jgi:RHS repeat-associated protein